MATLKNAKKTEEEEVEAVHLKNNYCKQKYTTTNNGKRDYLSKCKFCLQSHPFGMDFCPAWKKDIPNHFSGSEICKAREKRGSAKWGESVGALFLGVIEANNVQNKDHIRFFAFFFPKGMKVGSYLIFSTNTKILLESFFKKCKVFIYVIKSHAVPLAQSAPHDTHEAGICLALA